MQPSLLAAYPSASFHPVLSGNKANLTLAPLLYEGLFAVDSQFQAVPLLCESYTVSEDRLTWTFTLRSGVTFSDGTPLTGETAAQALQTALDPASRYAGRLSGVQSIRGGEGQVVLTLSQPNSSLPLLLDIPIALGTGARPLGTGPYLLTDSGGSLSLTARSDWWQGSGSLPVQEIRLASLTKSDELVSAFNSGEVSLIDVDLTGNSELGSSGSYQVWDYPLYRPALSGLQRLPGVPGPGGPPGRGPGHRPGRPGGDYLRPARGGGGHPGPPRLSPLQ